ncbi:1-phosphofructokinase family hexose kinase [Panacibacter ginsenosidivorans]|uniref:1-phosphofructokinase family hexose kinase n=1 Tax=Panacibacter ginsenosidivorans TaxID=1813871 RepID=A0A5B8V434_9BACT|nr:1-phosphofructokinase family hexose kinase [Panacibacter ginsenosidivorans]QEC65938.1 1-phosphofructokinase family hexose kinase [Panacibacter ginsenosidivorans]
MPSIITITVNPCIDKSCSVERIMPEKKLRCGVPKFEPGGGGINVSRAIQKLGGSSLPVFLGGGPVCIMLQQLLEKENIYPHIIPIKDNTRENFIVHETSTGNQYRFGMPGPSVAENELQQCIDFIAGLQADYVVASGSLTPNAPVDFFARIGKVIRYTNTKYIVDTSGDAIKHALQQGIYLWKPNLGELSAYAGYDELSADTAVEAARKVIAAKNAEVIVVSMGAAGALLVTKDITERFAAPVVKRKSTVGAGDSMVAGIVYSIANGKPLSDAVRYGVMCGTAATMNYGTELCRKEDVEYLYNQHY